MIRKRDKRIGGFGHEQVSPKQRCMAGIWQLARWPGREHWGVAKKNHFQRPRRGPKWATNKVSALLAGEGGSI